MKKYAIYCNNEECLSVGYVRRITMSRTGGHVALECHWTMALLFDTYSEACAVLAFIVGCVNECFDGYLSVHSFDLGGE